MHVIVYTVICSPRLKCPVLCADFIVLVFVFLFLTAVIFVLPFGVIKNNTILSRGNYCKQTMDIYICRPNEESCIYMCIIEDVLGVINVVWFDSDVREIKCLIY